MNPPLRIQLSEGPPGAGGELVVWAALLALTASTWGLAYVHLGPFQVPVALAIAVAKATLVATYFMGLIEQRGTRRFALPVAIGMLLLLLGLTVFDVGTRFPLVKPASGPSAVPEKRPASERATRRALGAPLPHRIPGP